MKYKILEEEQQLTETLFQFLTSMTMREIKLQDEELLLNLASSLSAYGGRKDMKR